MGFDEGNLVLDRQSYSTGETILGKLVFDQEKVKTFRGIYVQFKGSCDVHWTTEHRREVDGRTEYYTVDHDSHETYFKQRVYLIGSDHGEVHLQPGHHEFPFQFLVPVNCPSSFNGSYGSIEYELKCVVDRAMKFDQEKKTYVDITAVKDLNTDPFCREPITFKFHESYCCWCMSSGICEVEVKLPAAGYVPGQTAHIEVNCNNKSNVELDSIKLELRRETTYTASYEPDHKTFQDTIASLKKGPIPGNTTRNWIVELELPKFDVRNVDFCKYIDVDYEFIVKLSVSGCHSDSKDSTRVIIGHIPLREFEGPEQNQIQNSAFVPQQTHVPTPCPPNPGGNPPYHGANPPYHGANPPYHEANPPYPGANPPYPGANAPYPQNNPSPMPMNRPMMNLPPAETPYPPNLSTFKPDGGHVSPYPGQLPNPGVNPAYPGVNPPYPGLNPPYPGVNPPYPGVNPPYPGANPPYPQGNSPYPPNAAPMQLGFNIPPGEKSEASMPLLPPGGAPYPTNTPPYPNPSAPEPSTPDALNSKN